MRHFSLSLAASVLLIACFGEEFRDGSATIFAEGGAGGKTGTAATLGGNVSASMTTLGGSAALAGTSAVGTANGGSTGAAGAAVTGTVNGGSAGVAGATTIYATSGGKPQDDITGGKGGEGASSSAGAAPTSIPAACRDLPKDAASGIYVIDPDGSGPLQAFEASCDMQTAGGGWTLVLNYVHKGGSNPSLAVRSDSLPVLGADLLGADESSSPRSWGHAGTAMLALLKPSALRFNARISLHQRIIDFVTTDANCLAYGTSGKDSCKGVATAFTALSDHTAQLPRAATSFNSGQGNLALTEFPFYLGGQMHWGIRGAGNRWEADNTPVTGVPGYTSDTIHRVWAR